MFDRRHIGHRFEPYKVEVEKGALRLFAKAIGEREPIHVDEAAARAAGYRSIVAPPTFVFALEGLNPTPWPVGDLLDFPVEKSIHAEQSFEYFLPVCAGDHLTLCETIVDMFDKKSGTLEFVVSETDVTDEDGRTVVKMRATAVVIGRNGDS